MSNAARSSLDEDTSGTDSTPPPRPPRAPEMPGRDAADLEWLLGDGGATFERSTAGAILERLLRESDSWKPCAICAGAGILTSAASVRQHVAAKKPTERRDRHEFRRVPVSGTGSNRDGHGVLESQLIQSSAPVEVGSWCQFCGGTGAVPERRPKGSRCHAVYVAGECTLVGGLDAQPKTATPTDSARTEPNSTALVRFARTSRRLSLLAEHDRLVLVTYHGDVGARWGREPAGRIFALYALTRGGRSLLGKGKGLEGGGGIAGAAERLWGTVAAHLAQPRHRTHAALATADEEARKQLAHAIDAWVATDAPRRTALMLRRLERRFPAPLPALDQAIAEIESWDPEVWEGAPSRGTDGVWR